MPRTNTNLGGAFKETDPRRKTKWRAEKVVYLPNGGKTRIKVRAMTKAEALAALVKKEKAVLRANPSADKLTLEMYLAQWLKDTEPHVKPGTLKEYRQVVDNHIIPSIGAIKLPDVRPVHVQRMLTAILTSASPKKRNGAKPPMHATANNARRYLKQAFRHAESLELIQTNPLRNIKPIRRPQVTRGVWQPHEIQAFLDASKVALRNLTYHAMFYTAFFTGLRKGELMALPWSNVTETHVHVDRSYSREAKGKVGPPKNQAANRRVPIGPNLRALLDEQRKRTGRYELVFANAAGRIMEDGNVNRAFRITLQRARGRNYQGKKLTKQPGHLVVPELRYISFHGTRRCAATYWARKGFTPKMIQELLGHATPHMAMDAYNEVLDEQMEGAFLNESDMFSGRMFGRTQDDTAPDETTRVVSPDDTINRVQEGEG